MKTVPTIGGRSYFDYIIKENNVFVRFGRIKKPIKVKNETVELVKKQVNDLIKKPVQRASFYNKKYWNGCPNNRISPYVAQLILLGKI